MAALEQGHSPNDTIDGTSPCSIPNPGGTPNPYTPGNFEGESGGVMTITDATVHSVNCAYARLEQVVGARSVVDVAHRMGITHKLQAIPSLTLGTEVVSPLEMVTAYSTLAADGERNDPFFVESVQDSKGKTVFRYKPKPKRVVAAQNARVETQVLQQVVQRGTAVRAQVDGHQVAAKTGTADDYHDAWLVGFTPQLATAVWMGSPKGEVPMLNVGGIRVQGGSYPAQIWGAYMNAVLAGQPSIPFPQPDFNLLPSAQQLGGPPTPSTLVPNTTPPTSLPPPTTPAQVIPTFVRPTPPPTRPPPTRSTSTVCYSRPSTTICR
jgi:membrane peptidoglycan carboxypeptidase